jgi:hypothetical protein
MKNAREKEGLKKCHDINHRHSLLKRENGLLKRVFAWVEGGVPVKVVNAWEKLYKIINIISEVNCPMSSV